MRHAKQNFYGDRATRSKLLRFTFAPKFPKKIDLFSTD